MSVYLDWAKLSRPSKRVVNKAKNFRKMGEKGLRSLEDELKELMAGKMKVKAERIGLAYNTTEAAACASRLLHLRGYPKVLSGPHEYQSILNIFLREDYEEANHSLITHHNIGKMPKIRENGQEINIRDGVFWKKLSLNCNEINGLDSDTMVLLSMVSRMDGLMPEIEKLSKKIKLASHRTPILIDGAQCLDLPDIHNLNCDAFIGCFHKHFGGIPALGFFYIPENSVDKIEKHQIEWEQEMNAIYGTAIVGALEALKERKDRLVKTLELAGKIKHKIKGIGGIISEEADSTYAGHIISFSIPGIDGDLLQKELAEREIDVSYLNKTDEIRVSTNPLNTKHDIEIFGKALADTIKSLK